MKLSKRLLLILGLTLGLTALGCSEDGSDDGMSPQDGPPDILAPNINTTVNFNSNDTNAQAAQSQVSSSLLSANAQAQSSSAFLSPLSNSAWGNQSSGCYSQVNTSQGCTIRYEACETASLYTWAATWNGTCGGQTYTNFTVFSGQSNLDGTQGSWSFYNPLDTDEITLSVSWTSNAAGTMGSWTYYAGDLTADIIATLTWEETGDGGSSIVWEFPEVIRWEFSANAAGNQGTWTSYRWEDPAWIIASEIVWNADGTGSWTTYDNEGVPTTQTWN